MIFRLKRFLALIVSLVVLTVAFLIFAAKIVTYSLPDDYSEYRTDSVGHFVELYRNDFGVPHIVAANEPDMYFMLGFAQAQDRLWQLDYLRRLALGNTAEIFGRDNLLYDKFIRAFDFDEVSKATYHTMSNEAKSALIAYSKGVNFYLRRRGNKLPFEFDFLEYAPQEWKPTDCIAIVKLFSLKTSPGFRNDLIMGQIADKFGIEKANELIAKYPLDAPHIYEKGIPKIEKLPTDSASAPIQSVQPAPVPAKKLALSNIFTPTMNAVTAVAGRSNAIGSNAWAVNRAKNNHYNTVLACDPHLSLDIPSVWYQAKLTTRRNNLTGIILSGTPIMLIGRNQNISWGITNAMIDDFDYYYEKINPKNKNYYYSADSGVAGRFRFKIDTIKVKNEPDYLYYKRSTRRSGVISDFHISNPKAKKKDNKAKPFSNPKAKDYLERYCITYKWTGSRPHDFVTPMLRIYRANNLSAFRLALNSWHSPALNFVFADKQGNIAVTSAGAVPLRSFECNPNIPNPGWLKSSEWTGYLPASQLPLLKNPAEKFVFAANNSWFHSRPTFISDYWDSPSRAERIDSLLRGDFSYSARDAQIMQSDQYSPQAEKIVKQALPYLTKHYSSFNLTEKRAFERLKKWNFVINPRRISSVVYNQLYLSLLDNVYRIHFGSNYKNVLKMQNRASLRLMTALMDSTDNLLKYNRNPNARTYEKLFVTAYKKAIEKLTIRFQTNDIRKWKYGELHCVELKHPFAANNFLKAAFTLSAVQYGGNASTLNNAEYDLNKPFEVITGASCRFISDMQEKYVYTSIPGGISGQNYSSYFSDQFQIWAFGGYVKLPVSKEVQNDFKKSIRIANPNIIN